MRKRKKDTALGRRMADARAAKGLSQTAVAVALGVDKTTVSKWESGDRTPGLRLLLRLGELYGVSYDLLLVDHVEEVSK